MKKTSKGQSSVEFLLVASVMVVCLLAPVFNGSSASQTLITEIKQNQERYMGSLTGRP